MSRSGKYFNLNDLETEVVPLYQGVDEDFTDNPLQVDTGKHCENDATAANRTNSDSKLGRFTFNLPPGRVKIQSVTSCR